MAFAKKHQQPDLSMFARAVRIEQLILYKENLQEHVLEIHRGR